jgi:hypothetical protein
MLERAGLRSSIAQMFDYCHLILDYFLGMGPLIIVIWFLVILMEVIYYG